MYFKGNDQNIQSILIDIIGSIDDKIENNLKIIEKLNSLIDLEYKSLSGTFLESTLEKMVNISIGRTPPRNEKEWFTKSDSDIKWLSIKDMNNSSLFIFDTSEKLIKKAITKFNYTIANENDILMSFKLTVGIVSIAGIALVTNEAIATFKPKEEYLRWYLYCYLKHSDFKNAGNTSSIATAINSTIIKKYKFYYLPEEDLIIFNIKIGSFLKQIKKLIFENNRLQTIKQLYLKKFFG